MEGFFFADSSPDSQDNSDGLFIRRLVKLDTPCPIHIRAVV
jgi:hypothetical protein